MASSDRFVAVGAEEILYIISNIFAKPQVFYYLVSDAKIFDIIYQLSPLLEYDPTVCLPSNKGDNCINVNLYSIKIELLVLSYLWNGKSYMTIPWTFQYGSRED